MAAAAITWVFVSSCVKESMKRKRMETTRSSSVRTIPGIRCFFFDFLERLELMIIVSFLFGIIATAVSDEEYRSALL